jgi:glutamine synthetase
MDTLVPVDPVHKALVTDLEANGVEYVFGSFIDITGRAKSKCVPIEHLPALLAGHERYTPAASATSVV